MRTFKVICCTKHAPWKMRHNKWHLIWHPDAVASLRELRTGGQVTEYVCPNCHLKWWGESPTHSAGETPHFLGDPV